VAIDCGAGKSKVPVVVSYRDSLLSDGLVAIFINQTSNRLTISYKFENKALGEVKEGAIDIKPNAKVEIGWLEGWNFVSGDTITVSHHNYRSFTTRIP
jgi:hypothetical protein